MALVYLFWPSVVILVSLQRIFVVPRQPTQKCNGFTSIGPDDPILILSCISIQCATMNCGSSKG